MPPDPAASCQRYATYVGLTGLFFTFLGLVTERDRRRGEQTTFAAVEFVQLSLATYRLGRLIAFDKVTETYRLPFTRTEMDEYGASETVVPRGEGARRAIGELISCPICTGTWVSAFLVYGLKLFPRFTRTLVAIMSIIGAAELLNALTEAMQWSGELARKQVGQGK